MTTTRHPEPARPIIDGERADVLDALRGFALLGILVSHIPDFSGYSFMPAIEQAALDRFGVQAVVAPLQDFLIRGKFYSLFALLFGIGFSVQLESAARRGGSFARHFSRRLTVLFAIGLLHATIWYGDILKDYALLGFALIPLRGATVRTVAATFVAVLSLRIIWPVIMWWIVPIVMPGSAGGNPGGGFAEAQPIFAGGDAGAVLQANFALVRLKALQMVYDGRALSILAMFLLGVGVGKAGIYRDVARRGRLFATVFWVCAPPGVIGNIILTRLHAATPDFPPGSVWVVENMLYAVAVPTMAIAYASGFAALWARGCSGSLQHFAPAGRMALTTYVLQTLIGIVLFYGIGFGLHGRVGLVEGTGIAIGVFAGQCALSRIWLRHFHFGPIEWVWRRLTYGIAIPFRRGVAARGQHG